MTKSIANTLMCCSIALLAVTGSAPASAGVVDFEDQQVTVGCGNGLGFVSTQSGGFIFGSSTHFICDGADQGVVSNDTKFILTTRSPGINMARAGIDALPFSVNSFDAAEASSFFISSLVVSGSVSVFGIRFGGVGTVSQTFSFDGIFDGPGGQPDFQTFHLSNDFTNLQFVQFNGLTANGEQSLTVALDNIRFDEPSARVPEPATLALVGIALAGVWVRRRRE